MGLLSGKKGKKEKNLKDKESSSTAAASDKPIVWRNLLVLDGNEMHEWVEKFAKVRLADGSRVRVVQASWMDIDVVVYPDAGCQVAAMPVHETNGCKKPNSLTFTPDFVLMRNQPRGPTPGSDRRNQLFGLMNANLPAVNSLMSEYMNLERPIMMAALRAIEAQLGHAAFPLIPHTYYANPGTMVISPDLPAIVKVWHAHAGMGKIQVKDQTEFRDLATVLALHHQYASAEPFIDAEYGIRVQKIGTHIRVYKKIFTGSGWKSQFGGADLQNVSPDDEEFGKFKSWADAVSASALGQGMKMFAIDALHTSAGEDVIIELNGTAIGFHSAFYEEDSDHVVEVVTEKLQEAVEERQAMVASRKEREASASVARKLPKATKATDSGSGESDSEDSVKDDAVPAKTTKTEAVSASKKDGSSKQAAKKEKRPHRSKKRSTNSADSQES